MAALRPQHQHRITPPTPSFSAVVHSRFTIYYFLLCVTLSPDQTLLYVADYRSHWVYSYVIKADGSLDHKQRFYWLHSLDSSDQSSADGLRVDREGRLYVATNMGIQVCDQAGKVQCIIPTPNGRLSNFTFGGERFDTLFATCGDRVYKRKMKVVGANGWDQPNKPAAPRL